MKSHICVFYTGIVNGVSSDRLPVLTVGGSITPSLAAPWNSQRKSWGEINITEEIAEFYLENQVCVKTQPLSEQTSSIPELLVQYSSIFSRMPDKSTVRESIMWSRRVVTKLEHGSKYRVSSSGGTLIHYSVLSRRAIHTSRLGSASPSPFWPRLASTVK